eukprot:15303976-Heterocapsa_arctica.AAC.1
MAAAGGARRSASRGSRLDGQQRRIHTYQNHRAGVEARACYGKARSEAFRCLVGDPYIGPRRPAPIMTLPSLELAARPGERTIIFHSGLTLLRIAT